VALVLRHLDPDPSTVEPKGASVDDILIKLLVVIGSGVVMTLIVTWYTCDDD
jgi:hypothetical protein